MKNEYGPERKDTLTLDRVKMETPVEVERITGGWGIRQRFCQMGLQRGVRIRVKRSAIMNGPIIVEIQGVDVALGRGMARKVIVHETHTS